MNALSFNLFKNSSLNLFKNNSGNNAVIKTEEDKEKNLYLDTKLLNKKQEIKQQLEKFNSARIISSNVQDGTNGIFELLGNMRSILVQNMGSYDINKKDLEGKISSFLSEIDNLSKINFNEIQLLNGSLNINFLLFNKNYNLNITQDLSSSGLGLLEGLDSNLKSVEKIDYAQELTSKQIEKNKKFQESINAGIENYFSKNDQNNGFKSFLEKTGNSLKGNFINLNI